jgi:hypothetical protein
MKKLFALLLAIIVIITLIISSSSTTFENLDQSNEYAGVPPIVPPKLPPPVSTDLQ